MAPMRMNEADQVRACSASMVSISSIPMRRRPSLAARDGPGSETRKFIGKAFIDLFEEEAAQVGGAVPAQGHALPLM